jgi:hypothetical protein
LAENRRIEQPGPPFSVQSEVNIAGSIALSPSRLGGNDNFRAQSKASYSIAPHFAARLMPTPKSRLDPETSGHQDVIMSTMNTDRSSQLPL